MVIPVSLHLEDRLLYTKVYLSDDKILLACSGMLQNKRTAGEVLRNVYLVAFVETQRNINKVRIFRLLTHRPGSRQEAAPSPPQKGVSFPLLHKQKKRKPYTGPGRARGLTRHHYHIAHLARGYAPASSPRPPQGPRRGPAPGTPRRGLRL